MNGAALNVPGCASWVAPGLASIPPIPGPGGLTCAAVSLSAQVGRMALSRPASVRHCVNYFNSKVSPHILGRKSFDLVPFPSESAWQVPRRENQPWEFVML